MTLQQVLDLLKRNDEGKLFRKDRIVRFYIEPDGEPYDIAGAYLDDEGEICVDLVAAEEAEEIA